MNTFVTSILIMLLSALTLHGIERRFTVVSPYGGKQLKELGYLNDDGDFQQLKWSRQRRSPVYSAPRSGDVILVKPVITEEGQTIYQPMLELPWVGESDLALFVVVVIDGAPMPRVLSVDDRLSTFPVDTLKVLNGLNKTIYTLAGERKFQLAPSQLSQAFPTEGYHVIDRVLEEDEEGEPNPGMPLAVGVEADGDYDLIYAAGISISPSSRVLCLVLPPKAIGSNRYQARVILR